MTAAFGYVDGYKYGQHDALSLVCLAHNLAAAGALCRAFIDGCTQGIAGLFNEIETLKTPSVAKCRPWVPGCGREASR